MSCEMLKTPATVVIAYIAVVSNPLLVSHASHFIDSYRCHPPGYNNRLVVVSNGGNLAPKMRAIFAPVAHEMFPRANDGGWDISAYIDVAMRFDSDLQVCLGESVYCHRAGWLKRIVECQSEHGQGMYGIYSSYLVRPHLNTTAFAVSPQHLREYPKPLDKGARYAFEHGDKSLWRRIMFAGGTTRLVTWDGCWEPKDWRRPENILWRGDQSNCLLHSNHTDRWNSAHEKTKQVWTYGADAIAK